MSNIQTLSTCVNCSNLGDQFTCTKHQVQVGLSTACEDHNFGTKLTKESSCTNCTNLNTQDCTHPTKASSGMLCFDWKA